MTYDYFYGAQSDQFSFYRIPKALFTDAQFKSISVEAKIIYGILLDRMSLSRKNGWLDSEGRVYIFYTVEEITEAFHCAAQKAVKLLAELENKAGLIERKRQGLGRPNLIYVKNFVLPSKSQFQNDENHHSGSMKNTIQEFPKSQCSNTHENDNENNHTEINPIPSAPLQRERNRDTIRYDATEEQESMREYLEEQLEIDILKQENPFYENELDEIFEIILDTLCSHRQTIRIAGEEKPLEVVKSAFMKLNKTHIEYALDCLKSNTSDIRNIRAYILTTLYNSRQPISNYYTSRVHHNMPELAR